MDLVSDETHRALAFLGALHKQGYHPYAHEFDAYTSTHGPHTTVMEMLRARFESSAIHHEGMRKYLQAVHWIGVRPKDHRIVITELGRHVLAALDESVHEVSQFVEVVLDPEDPLALSLVVKRLAALGKALLVDPYFRLEQLETLIQYTQVDRVLMTDAVKDSDRMSLKHALETVPMRSTEVRIANKTEVHDRYAIPSHGPIMFIGASLNTVGRRPTVIGQLHDAADEIRKRYENTWAESAVLGVTCEARLDGKAQEQPGDEA